MIQLLYSRGDGDRRRVRTLQERSIPLRPRQFAGADHGNIHIVHEPRFHEEPTGSAWYAVSRYSRTGFETQSYRNPSRRDRICTHIIPTTLIGSQTPRSSPLVKTTGIQGHNSWVFPTRCSDCRLRDYTQCLTTSLSHSRGSVCQSLKFCECIMLVSPPVVLFNGQT